MTLFVFSQAERLQFICQQYAEEGSGCGELIGISLCTSDAPGSTGPHPDVLCEKCDQMGRKCTGHRRRRRNKKNKEQVTTANAAPAVSTPPVGLVIRDAPQADINNNEVITGKKNKRRPRRKSGVIQAESTVAELCQILNKL